MEINTEKAQYAVVSSHINIGYNRNLLTANKCFKNVATFKCLRTTVRNQNCIQVELTGDIKFGEY
jgi:hypothetical protein